MGMIPRIITDKQLKSFCGHDVSDSGVACEVDFRLSEDDYIAVKVDDYFKDIFCDDKYSYHAVELYLVSEHPQKAKQYGNYQRYLDIMSKVNANDTLRLDIYVSEREYIFRGKRCRIQRELPPYPIIGRR